MRTQKEAEEHQLGGSVPVALPHLLVATRTRVLASNNEVTEKRVVEEAKEESYVEADIGKAGFGTAESTPVIASNAYNKIPKGEEEAIAKVGENTVERLHAGGLSKGRVRAFNGTDIVIGTEK